MTYCTATYRHLPPPTATYCHPLPPTATPPLPTITHHYLPLPTVTQLPGGTIALVSVLAFGLGIGAMLLWHHSTPPRAVRPTGATLSPARTDPGSPRRAAEGAQLSQTHAFTKMAEDPAAPGESVVTRA